MCDRMHIADMYSDIGSNRNTHSDGPPQCAGRTAPEPLLLAKDREMRQNALCRRDDEDFPIYTARQSVDVKVVKRSSEILELVQSYK